MIPRVVTQNGLTIDLSQVKCFKSDILFSGSKIIVEFKTRYEYIRHPETGEYIKQQINDVVESECKEPAYASRFIFEWEETWLQYLTEQNKNN
ncbi:MAG: hypothetical protein LBT50_08995 [Prevotellaceae bacterium]|jgi:hypothetical protein|nr:hypothetical protein [Prevotellaceae bacterium]